MSRRGGRQKFHEEDSSESDQPKRYIKKSSQQPSTSQESAVDEEAISWTCSVCTYRNNLESFKCEMCESRKGTSTRKPRLNPSVVQQQTLVQLAVQQQSSSQSPSTRRGRPEKSRFSPESNDSGSPTPSRVIRKFSKLKKHKEKAVVPFSDDIVNRLSPKKRAITVRGITFVITEYSAKGKSVLRKPKKEESV